MKLYSAESLLFIIFKFSWVKVNQEFKYLTKYKFFYTCYDKTVKSNIQENTKLILNKN